MLFTNFISERELTSRRKILRISFQENPSVGGGGINARGVAKYSDFGQLACCISKKVQDRKYCVKVVDKAITVDNLQLLCLVVNVCRETARRPPDS